MSSISVKSLVAEPIKMALGALSIIYLVGIAGILGNIHPQFIYLTPLNLIFSISLVLFFHQNWKSSHIFFCVACFLIGLFSEILGVQTGLIFGEYAYGKVLGVKILETPLVIGINWLMLVYCASASINLITEKTHRVLKAFFAALAMVALDLLIEPVAIAYGFWNWGGEEIPLQNYLAWFVIAFILCLLFQFLVGNKKNKVALGLFILQFLFFLVLGLAN